jgi:transposase
VKIRKHVDIDVDEVRSAMKKTKSRAEFQRLQAILLRATRPDFDVEDISETVCLAVSTVWRIHSKYLASEELYIVNETRGGRRNCNFTEAEEAELLKPFFTKAAKSGVMTISEIKTAYEQKLGREVQRSVIYRMLERHGWRKIVPAKTHPKSDPEAQSTFKKTSKHQ